MHGNIKYERLDNILQSVSQAVICQEADGRVIYTNQAVRDIFGPDSEKALTHGPVGRQWELIYEDGSICPDEEHPSTRTLRTKEALRGEILGVMRKDQPLIWLSIDTNPIIAKGAEDPEAVVITFTDITRKKQAAEQEKSDFRRRQIAMDLANLVNWEYDIDSDLFVFDEKFYALYGTCSSEQGGIRMTSSEYASRFLPPEQIPVVSEGIKAAMDSPDPDFTRQIEHRIICADGQFKDIIVRYGLVKDETGRTVKLFGANQDLTGLKAVEEQLREAQAVSHTGSWQLDIPNNLLTLSEEARRLFGVSADPPDSLESLRAYIDPEDRESLNKAWAGALKGEPYVVEYRVGSGEDLRWISERAVVKFAPDGALLSGIGSVQDVTERRLATMHLESSERRFRALIEASTQIVWSADPKGYVFEDSPSWRAYTGQSIEEYMGFGYADAMHPEDREDVIERWGQGLELGEPVTNEFRLHHHSGQWRWSQSRAVPIKDDCGRIQLWVGMNIDINDQRQAENALRESEKKFHQAMYHAPIGMAILSLKGSWIDVNPSMCLIMGYSREELLTTDFQTITHPEDLNVDLEYVRQVIDGEISTYQMDKRYIHKDGHTVWAQLNVALVRDEWGEPGYFISQVQDISERKKNELEIRESERRFHAIIDASPVPLVIDDRSGNINYLNPAFTESFGYKPEDIPTLDDWWPKAYPDPAYQKEVKAEWLARAAKSDQDGEPFVPMEVRIRCKNGGFRTVLATSTPLSGFAEKTNLVTLFDITQINNISQRLKTLLATASDGIHVLDERGDIVEFSESFARMLGYTPEEAQALNVADWEAHIPPAEIQSAIRSLIQSSDTFESKHRRKDGTVIDVEINAKGISLDGRRLLYASSRDITERKEALRALAESEERFNLAVSGSNDGIWDWKITTNILFWSSRFKEILGYGPDEIEVSLDKWLELIHPDDRDTIWAAVNDHLEKDLPYDIEYRMLHKDGYYTWVRARGKAVRSESGDPLRMAGSIKDITDQKKAEFRLQEAMEFNDTVLLKSPLAMGVYRQDGQCVLANEALAEMAGATRDEILAHNFYQIEAWKTSGLIDACLAAFKNGQQYRHEMHTVSSFGKEIWASVSIFPTMLNNVPHVLVQLADQTEIQNANSALRSASYRLELATKAAALGIWEWDLANDVLSWDDRLLELYEVPQTVKESGLYYDFWRSRCHVDDLAEIEGALEAAIKGEREFDCYHRIVMPDKTVKHLHVTAIVEKDSEGKPARMIGTKQDITPLKKTEESLQRTLTELSIILENASVGITMLKNRVQLRTNRKLSEMFGYSPDEMVGQSTRPFYASQEEYERFGREAHAEVLQGGTYTTELQMQRKDGSLLWVRLTGKAIDPDDQDSGSIWVLEDITEAKAREEELREAKGAAEQASRMKSEFLANMSHEIRTPMNAVLGLSQLLLDTELDELQRDYLGKLHSASQSLLGIINDILDYSKIEAGKLDLESTEFQLSQVLESTAKLFSFSAEAKGLELVFDAEPDLPPVVIGDPLRLRQVINNLLGNAIKFTKSGHIKLGMRRLAQNKDKLTLEVAVSDSGIGMTKEQVKRLFNAFEQADSSTTRKFGGTGLGLTISKHLVEMMNGQIRVESELDLGSTFSFTVELAVSGAKYPKHSAADLRGMRTLVVEDEGIARDMMLGILESWGFQVDKAESGEQGLEMALKAFNSGDSYELILMDWKLPGVDGVELAKTLREEETSRQPDMQPAIVIMVTAFGRQQAKEVIKGVDFDAVLDKPVIASQLFNLVANLQGFQPEPSGSENWSGLQEASDRLSVIAGAKILLVEDNPTNQLVANDLLTRLGLKVDLAVNGLEAVDKSAANQYDAILMDLQMPELDGIEATHRIRKLPGRGEVPIIAMTAAAMQEDRAVCLAAGMNDFVAKPIDVGALTSALLRFIPSREKAAKIKDQSPAAEPVAPPQDGPFLLEGMNLKAAVARLANNWGLLRRAITAFARDFAQSADFLEKHLAEGRTEDAVRLLHTAKGLAKMIGADRLSEISQRLESELKSGHAIEPEPFRLEMTKTLSIIATLDESGAEPEPPAGSHDLEVLAKEMFSLVSKSGFVPPELAAETGAMLKTLGSAEMAQRLNYCIESFDYTAAKQLLEKIADSHGFKLEE